MHIFFYLPTFIAMPMLGYSVPPELAISALGQPPWADRIPNIYASGLTKLEIEPLVACWQESMRVKTRTSPFHQAIVRLIFFTMRKAIARRCANKALHVFRPAELFVDRAGRRFREYLVTLPSVPDVREEQVDKIKKLGRLLWINIGVLDASWQEFLKAQCIIELDDLD